MQSTHLSEEFNVKVGVNQGSFLSPYCSSHLWKSSHKSFVQDAPGKTCMQMTWSSSLSRWRNCKRNCSSGTLTCKGLGIWVSMSKTKALISGLGLDMLQKSDKETCAEGLKGVGANSIFCVGCSSWVNKRYSGVSGFLKPDPRTE